MLNQIIQSIEAASKANIELLTNFPAVIEQKFYTESNDVVHKRLPYKVEQLFKTLNMVDHTINLPEKNLTYESTIAKLYELKPRFADLYVRSETKIDVVEGSIGSSLQSIIDQLKEQIILIAKSPNDYLLMAKMGL